MNNGSMAAIADALTFLTSEVADTQSRLASDEFNGTQQLLLAVSGLNKRLETLEHQIQSHQADAQLAVNTMNDRTRKLKHELGSAMLDTLSSQSALVQQRTQSDISYLGYAVTLAVVITLCCLVIRKVRRASKKHIL